MKYTVLIWSIISVALIAYAVLLRSALNASMEQNCVLGAMKASGNVPHPETIKWCKEQFNP